MNLSTVCALIAFLFASIAAAAAWSAARSALSVIAAGDEVERARRALKVAADRLSLLEGRVDRLTGRVYAQGRKPAYAPPQNDIDQRANGIERPNSGDIDPELAAELALQLAPAVAPGRS